jgi:hypothetical protein
MINIYHGQACGRMLKHSTKRIEESLLNDEQQEHNASQLLVPQANTTP